MLVGRVVHRHDQVPHRAGNPLVGAAVLVQQHPRPRRRLPPPAVRPPALAALDRAVRLQLGPDPVVAAGAALPAAERIVVADVPPRMPRPVAVHHPHHLVNRRRLRLRQPPLRPQRVRVLEHRHPPVLVDLNNAHDRPRTDEVRDNLKPDSSRVTGPDNLFVLNTTK